MRNSLATVLLALICTGCSVHEPSRRWEGLWRADFEASQFCPAPATECFYVRTNQRKQPIIWLKFTDGMPAEIRKSPGGLYKIAFDGRRSLFRGHFGHMGMFDREIIVDRLISIQKPKLTDEQMQKLRAEAPYLTEACLNKIRWGGIESLKETDDCAQRLPPARWRGLWRNDFEGSLFCPAPAQECTNRGGSPGVWLQLEPRPAAVRDAPPGGLYAVEFIGRRTARGSPYEAYGFQQDMIVDRLISIKEIEAPPK